jgi:hypothetical protein
MSPAQRDPVDARLDEIAKLLALLVGRDRSLQDTIGDMSALGLGPTRIAELTGTSAGYAKVAADRAKKKAAAKGSKKPAA